MRKTKVRWTRTNATQYSATERGYTGTITIATNGSASLAVTGSGSKTPPSTASYTTRGLAKEAFEQFIRTTTPTA